MKAEIFVLFLLCPLLRAEKSANYQVDIAKYLLSEWMMNKSLNIQELCTDHLTDMVDNDLRLFLLKVWICTFKLLEPDQFLTC